MIYRSNLEAPDLQPHFKHVQSRVMGHSFGHDVLSDFADLPANHALKLYKECGFWTHDEAAILYNIATQRQGRWIDIGSHTGWTAAHLAAAGCNVLCVEPMFADQTFFGRFLANHAKLTFEAAIKGRMIPYAERSDEFFPRYRSAPVVPEAGATAGIVIDGDHNAPVPLQDARWAEQISDVILFHDAMGGPVWDGIYHLLDNGFHCHVFFTPHIVAACSRSPRIFPEHVPDPSIDWNEIKSNHMKDFDWRRVTHDAIA